MVYFSWPGAYIFARSLIPLSLYRLSFPCVGWLLFASVNRGRIRAPLVYNNRERERERVYWYTRRLGQSKSYTSLFVCFHSTNGATSLLAVCVCLYRTAVCFYLFLLRYRLTSCCPICLVDYFPPLFTRQQTKRLGYIEKMPSSCTETILIVTRLRSLSCISTS